ncbi:uncharacterized protein H6S33_011450 [Morchella sextelata]|uniref:uncharacterized protein n=1 Tax=Morchella sextelata TaxID=1174677 RepID=UPI001D05A258|nr:uncharacterized protein H6S33_011450 [Morchella sextelata]KAH0611023.1 hypothetical protein H6S33_011450 [Morchella sextelata]
MYTPKLVALLMAVLAVTASAGSVKVSFGDDDATPAKAPAKVPRDVASNGPTLAARWAMPLAEPGKRPPRAAAGRPRRGGVRGVKARPKGRGGMGRRPPRAGRPVRKGGKGRGGPRGGPRGRPGRAGGRPGGRPGRGGQKGMGGPRGGKGRMGMGGAPGGGAPPPPPPPAAEMPPADVPAAADSEAAPAEEVPAY